MGSLVAVNTGRRGATKGSAGCGDKESPEGSADAGKMVAGLKTGWEDGDSDLGRGGEVTGSGTHGEAGGAMGLINGGEEEMG